jgi:spermidine/putrescine transport system ATP-binding protein
MRHGRIEQLGRPEELYERPATTFVAGFLGVSNLLDGEVVGRGGDLVEVRLADGTMVRAPATAANGETRVRVGVRPEKLRATPGNGQGRAAGDDTNTLTGTVLDASYVGVSTQYIVETADGHKLTVYAQNLETSGASEALADGQAVHLSWKPQHTFVISRADEATDQTTEIEEGQVTP